MPSGHPLPAPAAAIQSEVVVVGAGLAGLTAALHLADRGVPVRLLEADALFAGGRLWGGRPHPLAANAEQGDGGAVRLTLKGLTQTFLPEHGIHGLWNEYHNLRGMLRRFGLNVPLRPAREQAWVHGEGEWVRRAEVGSVITNAHLPPPLHYLELFTRPDFLYMLGLRDWLALPRVWNGLLLAVALDPFTRLIPLEGRHLEHFFEGWSPRLRALFVGLARSGLAASPEAISLAAFLASLRFYTALRRDALRFDYFLTDPGTALINPMIDCLTERHGEVLLGHTVEALAPGRSPAGWELKVATPRGLRRLRADHVILAVDAPAARRLLVGSPATAAQAAALHWPDGLLNAVVRLWFDQQPFPGNFEAGIFTGDFVVDNFFWLDRLQPDVIAWSKQTGGSALEMHLYQAPAFFDQPDAVILARAITDVYRAWPELRGHLRAQALQRNAATHSRLIVDQPDRWLGVHTPWPNLWACGDWVRGPWPAMHLERACVSGLEAANAVLRAVGGEPFAAAPYSQPEWFAGRLQAWLLGGRAWLRSVARRPRRS